MATYTDKDDRITILGDEVRIVRMSRKTAREIDIRNNDDVAEALDDVQAEAEDATAILIIIVEQGSI